MCHVETDSDGSIKCQLSKKWFVNNHINNTLIQSTFYNEMNKFKY